jgi:hypothetical protein
MAAPEVVLGWGSQPGEIMRLARLARPIVLLPLVFVVGCLSENKGKIEGTRWVSRPATISAKMAPPGYPSSVRVPGGYLELHFHQDGNLYYIIRGKIHTGKYSLGMGNIVTFHLDEPVAGMKIHAEKIVIDGEQMSVTDSDGTQLTFDKQ